MAAVGLVQESAELSISVGIVAIDYEASRLAIFARWIKGNDVDPRPSLKEVVGEGHLVPWVMRAKRLFDNVQGCLAGKGPRRPFIRVGDSHALGVPLRVVNDGSLYQPGHHSPVAI